VAKAVVMLSGGLDSLLVVKTLIDLDIEVHAVHMVMPFGIPGQGPKKIEQVCKQMGVKLVIESRGENFFDLVRNPRFGYGKNMNPCIDCRIAMLKRAKQIMHEVGADFIATGEVVGQRPMSQRKEAMNQIENLAGVKGFVLRPLCAKHFEPTIVENNGLIDREKLYGIAGRGRKEQISLAEKIGITSYPAPAGGCELTVPGFSNRLRHLLEMMEETEVDDWNMLSVGRHLVLGPDTKAVISREEKENVWLKKFTKTSDGLLEPVNFSGPTAAIVGEHNLDTAKYIGSVMLRYGKVLEQGEDVKAQYMINGNTTQITIEGPASKAQIAAKLIS